MNRSENDPSDQLLEWHLNLLDEDAARWIEYELKRDARFQAQSQKLGRILQPLDHWSVHPGPPNLSENILNAVKQAGSLGLRKVPRRQEFAFPFFKIRDFAAVAASIALLLGVFVPGASALRSRSQRVLCASNMHGIAQGLSQYQANFAGSLPFAGFASDAAWLPPRDDPTCYSSNSRHVFQLFKQGYVKKPNAFLCPGNKDAAPMQVASLEECEDFDEGSNISYDSYNLAGNSPNLRPSSAIAYLADPNPLFIGARVNGDIDPQVANSPAHGGRGQTVLLLDGRTEYMRTPVYGDHKDNLWTIDGVSKYTGNEIPTRPTDSFLVPGVPKIRR